MSAVTALARYIELRKKLHALSAALAPDEEVDAVLDTMDEVWLELTPEDLEALEGELQ